MKFTARSISRHDPNNFLGDIHLAWVTSQPSSQYSGEINEIKSIIEESHRFYLHDFSANLGGRLGWFAQQLLKLKIAQLLEDDYYIVLDSKNTLIRDVEADTFFSPCNQALVFAQYKMNEMPTPHNEWYGASSEALHVDAYSEAAGDDLWPASVTPMTIHRQTVLDMLKSLGEDTSPWNICGGPLCDLFQNGATEFTMYMLYSRVKANFECIHETLSPAWEEEIALSLWRGYDGSFDELKAVASKDRRPLMFGSQASALDGLPPEKQAEAKHLLEKVYTDAGLADAKEKVADCVVASQGNRLLRDLAGGAQINSLFKNSSHARTYVLLGA